jgi:hypothetical protein
MKGRLARTAAALAVAGLIVVAGAAPASAHALGSGGRASNYRTEVLGISPAVAGITARPLEAGYQLELTNRSGQEVVVLGYRSEPYLRVGPGGVEENRRSPSAYANRFQSAPSTIPAEFDPTAPPEWRRVADGRTAIWHDHRSHWSGPDPPAVAAARGRPQVVVPAWQIPLRVGGDGGRTVLVRGRIDWVPGPSPWPWAVLALVTFAAVVAAASSGRPGLLALAALLAVAADLTHTAASFAASTASLATKLYAGSTSLAGWVVAALAALRLLRGRTDTGYVYLLLAGVFVALAGALPDLGALARSQLPSALDPLATRAAIALSFGLGAGLVAAGLLGLRAANRPVRGQAAG